MGLGEGWWRLDPCPSRNTRCYGCAAAVSLVSPLCHFGVTVSPAVSYGGTLNLSLSIAFTLCITCHHPRTQLGPRHPQWHFQTPSPASLLQNRDHTRDDTLYLFNKHFMLQVCVNIAIVTSNSSLYDHNFKELAPKHRESVCLGYPRFGQQVLD